MEGKIRIQNLTNYVSIHSYLRRYKKGQCEKCGRVGKTHLAKRHGKEHERKIENYLELCPRCHIAYDRTEDKVLCWKRNLAKSRSHSVTIQPRACEYCGEFFVPTRKTRLFCSNSCAAKQRVKNGMTKREKDPKTGRYLALQAPQQKSV